jgi:hypothetical protein
MRKIKHLVFIFIVAVLTACNSDVFEEHKIGGNLIDGSTNVIMIDTFTVEGSTVKMDSVRTSGFNNVLLGKYKDPYFGNVKSSFFGEVDLGLGIKSRFEEGARIFLGYDSLVFMMYHDPNVRRIVGDTLADQAVSIHRVTQELKLPKNKNYYNAHDELSFEVEEIGSITFTPRLSINDLNSDLEKELDKKTLYEKSGVRIRLEDAIGQDIIGKVNSSDENENLILSEKVKWFDYFKGIVLRAGDNNSAIFSFQTGVGMKMRMYYHDNNGTQKGALKYYDFPVRNLDEQKKVVSFTNHLADFISDDYSYMSKINEIENVRDELSSIETEDLCFIQGGTGLMTKVRIPYVEQLNRMGLTGGILKAELVFSPKNNSYDKDLYPLPYSRFELYSTNKKNLFPNSDVNPRTNGALTSTYVYNASSIDESYYTFDVTSYVNNILLNGQEYDNALLITLPRSTIGNSVERLVIDNDRKSDTRIKLEVTYVVQNN